MTLTGTKPVDYQILNYLSDKDLTNICLVNKSTYETCQDDSFWYCRVMYLFKNIPYHILAKYKTTWKSYYQKHLSKIQHQPNFYISIGISQNRLDYVYMAVITYNTDIHVNCSSYLCRACITGKYDIVKFLIEHGADPNACDGSPLRYICSRGDLDMVKYLVEHGADPNPWHHRPVFNALRYEYDDIAKYLLSLM